MKGEFHDFIIWDNAKHKYDFLFNELKKKFQIIDVHEITWTKENFEKNLRRFYGPTLPNPQKKMKQCGIGPFLVIIYFDPNPIYQFRKTSLGLQMTNVNVYDTKRELRKFLEGEFPIHGSIHEKEANHDLTLILGKNVDDILKRTNEKWDGKIKEIKEDLFGTNGWDSIQDMFYLLNSTTNYVVLRNFEGYPEDIISEAHPDIDLLVDDQIHLPYMLNQLNIVEQKENLPYVSIDNKNVKLDFRYVGDTYYDEKWSKDILKRRVLFKNSIYVPNKEDYFYTLLYHCFIHGASLTNYKSKLIDLAKKLEIINFDVDQTELEIKLKDLLDKFMKKNKYMYTNSPKYKIRHNEILRLTKVAILTTKREGFTGLIRAIKGKIHRKIIRKNVSTN